MPESSQMPSNDAELVMSNALNVWCALYNRKVTDKAMDIWLRLYSPIDAQVLTKAVDRVTRAAVRMPTPGDLTKAILDVYEGELGGGPRRVEADPDCSYCKGTGFLVGERRDAYGSVAVKCKCRTEDRHTQVQRGQRHYIDKVGEDPGQPGHKIGVRYDPVSNETLYLAKDCPEGREFLAALRAMPSSEPDRRPKREKADQDLHNPKWLQELSQLNQSLNVHYSAQSTDPSLPRSAEEIHAVEQATGKRIARPRRKE